MRFVIVFIAALIIEGQCQFPLKHQTWVLINGGNKNIVQSMFDFDPLKVIVITFKDDERADFTYANLSDTYIRSTSEALDYIWKEFGKNRVAYTKTGRKIYKASFQPFPDDQYSCTKGMLALAELGIYNTFFTNGSKVQRQSLANEQWFSNEPNCYASRNFNSQFDNKKINCLEGWCGDPSAGEGSKNDPRYHDVCNEESNTCRMNVTDFETKPSTSMFWNLHVYPKIVWHPRNPITGRVIHQEEFDDIKMKELRSKAIASQAENEKQFLSPELSKAKSVIFSAQFSIPTSTTPHQIKNLDFDLISSEEGATSFYHYPERAYRVSSMFAKAEIMNAILLPFANEKNIDWVKDINMNCPDWRYKDKQTGLEAFRIDTDVQVKYSENIPLNKADPSWYTYKDETVTNNDGSKSQVVSRELIDSPTEKQTAIVRNTDFPYQDYWWKGCPDRPRYSSFPYTKQQLKEVLYHSVSKCDPHKFSSYKNVYEFIANKIFWREKDGKEHELAQSRVNQTMKYLNRLGSSRAPASRECPENPMDILVRKYNVLYY